MTAIAPTDKDRATEFAAAVRERLSDLPPEELDELLDGLQADLTDRLADGGELGDPGSYADEMRQAAGLPPRSEGPGPKSRRGALQAARETWEAAGERFTAYWEAGSSRRAIRDFALALRPLWWVARGFLVAWVAAAVIGGSVRAWQLAGSPVFLMIALACIVVSVQWGRGRWVPQRWLVWLRRAVSAGAIVALLPVTGFIWNDIASEPYYEAGPSYWPGLTSDDLQIGNIFAYDCNGEPLDGVQLFTRDGQPLTTLEGGEPPWFSDDQGVGYQYRKNALVELPNGWSGWNVFPLRQAEQNMNTGEFGPVIAAEAPFQKVPELSDACPVPGGAQDADPDGTDAGSSGSVEPMTEVQAGGAE